MASMCLYQQPKMGLFVLYKKITDPQTLALDVRETWWLILRITAPWAFWLRATVTVINFAVGTNELQYHQEFL